MKLTKEVVQQVKKSGEDALLEFVSHFKYDNSKVFFILNSLGYLPRSFKGYWLFDYSTHENPKIRLAAIKNIGKLKLNGEINQLKDLLYAETKTEIRREIISSIGRQKNKNAQPILFKILQDNDPKIVCQAIRALLIFKNDEKVIKRLKELRNHKNEMVQAVIEREFFSHLKVNSNLHHTETFNFLKNTIVHGDVREILKSVPDESVHLTFTSPPYYNARDYSIYPSYKDYLKFLEEVFQATYRITKEGRFLLINTSPIILPRVSRKHSSKRYPIPYDLHHYIVKIGWEYIDDIIWLKPDASVKNRVGGFQQHRKPLGYKPNTVTEMIMVYRKKTTKLLDWNMRQYSKEIIEKSRVVPEARDRYRVRRELGQRDSMVVIKTANKWMDALDKSDPNYERYVLEVLWLHQSHHVYNENLLKRILESKDFRARAAATRVLSYWHPQVQDVIALMKPLLNDKHPRVRAEALRTASYIGAPELKEMVLDVLNFDTDKYIEYLLEETLGVLEE